MSRAPNLLRGATRIGDWLNISAGRAMQLHQQRHLPTFCLPGDSAPCATAAGLDDWRKLAPAEGLLER